MQGRLIHLWTINGLFQRGGLGRVILVREPGHPYPHQDRPYEAATVPHPRLIVVTRGKRRVRLMRGGRAVEERMVAGDAVFIPNDRWLVTFLEGSFSSLVVSFQPTLTRFCLSSFDEKRSRDRHVQFPLKEFGSRYYHPLTMDEQGRQIADQLSASPARAADDPVVRRLAELFLLKSSEHLRIEAPETYPRSYLQWQAACQFVESNCHRAVDRTAVGAHLHVHPNHISRLFATYSKLTFQEYLRQARLQRSRRLLREPDLAVADVAALSGFASAPAFHRAFTRAFGITPGRERIRNVGS